MFLLIKPFNNQNDLYMKTVSFFLHRTRDIKDTHKDATLKVKGGYWFRLMSRRISLVLSHFHDL